jgi:hypothetical protein
MNEMPPKVKDTLQIIAIVQIATGGLYALTWLGTVISSCGTVLIAVTPLYSIAVAGFAIYTGTRFFSPAPRSGKYKLTAILQIVSVIGCDIYSVVGGIVTLVLMNNNPEVEQYLMGTLPAETSAASDPIPLPTDNAPSTGSPDDAPKSE